MARTNFADTVVEGTQAAGLPLQGNPVLVGVSDGSNVQMLKSDGVGTLLSRISDGANNATVNSTSPSSADYGLTVRNISRKGSQILTEAALTANAVFTTAWVDSLADGATLVQSCCFADQASASNGFVIQETDDTGNSSLYRTVNAVTTTANATSTLNGTIKARWWRVVFTNGATAQGTLELTATTLTTPTFAVTSSGNLAVAQSGAWTVSQAPTTSGGAALAKVLSAASTNATSVKSTAGQLYGYALTNSSAATEYVHFYDKAATPVVGTDAPLFTVGVPAGKFVQITIGSGTPFVNGIAYAITTGAADTDAGAVAAGDVTGFLLYK